MAAIQFELPAPTVTMTLRVTSSDGHMRAATPADLEAAGYVRAISPSPAVDAHREAEAWKRIDKWVLAARDDRVVSITPDFRPGKWYALAHKGNPMVRSTGMETLSPREYYSSKTEALEALAVWCEAQK